MTELSRVSHEEFASVGTWGTKLIIYVVVMSVRDYLLVMEVKQLEGGGGEACDPAIHIADT
jgi:hypothetical protein